MAEFFIWLVVSMILFGLTTVCGFKTKAAWDSWHNPKTLSANRQPAIANSSINIGVIKLKAARAFDDFDNALNVIERELPKESEKLAGQFSARGMGSSGVHLKAQMDLAVKAKEKTEAEFQKLQRNIEDILIESLHAPSFPEEGEQFKSEQMRLAEAQKRCENFYEKLNAMPKEWEKRIFNTSQITQDFNVLNNKRK